MSSTLLGKVKQDAAKSSAIPPQHPLITSEQIDDFERDGVVVLRRVFNQEWIDIMAEGVAQNMAHPSQYASENECEREEGRFFDDYCNWTRLAPFEKVVRESPAAALAAQVMQSQIAQFFHDHVLVKEANTSKVTPWHMDSPYYFVEGKQTVSMWIPLDPVHTSSLRFIAGSHKWERLVRPVSWADDSDFYSKDNKCDGNGDGNGERHRWMDVPDPDNTVPPMRVLEFPMEPGDVGE